MPVRYGVVIDKPDTVVGCISGRKQSLSVRPLRPPIRDGLSISFHPVLLGWSEGPFRVRDLSTQQNVVLTQELRAALTELADDAT